MRCITTLCMQKLIPLAAANADDVCQVAMECCMQQASTLHAMQATTQADTLCDQTQIARQMTTGHQVGSRRIMTTTGKPSSKGGRCVWHKACLAKTKWEHHVCMQRQQLTLLLSNLKCHSTPFLELRDSDMGKWKWVLGGLFLS